MKDDCVFCKIIAGELPASFIYRDELVCAFPVLGPVNPGHLIIIPNEHFSCFSEVPAATAAHIMTLSQKMAAAIRKSSFRCEGINLFLADGETAGQEVFHFHFHVYPRFEGDGFGFKHDPARHFIEQTRPQLDSVAQEIKRQLEVSA